MKGVEFVLLSGYVVRKLGDKLVGDSRRFCIQHWMISSIEEYEGVSYLRLRDEYFMKRGGGLMESRYLIASKDGFELLSGSIL